MDRPSEILPEVERVYEGMAVVATSDTSPVVVDYLRRSDWEFSVMPRKAGLARREALRLAMDAGADLIHVVDLFQLLHWLESRPEELRSILDADMRWPLTVIGRSEAVIEDSPGPLREAHRLVALFTEVAFGQPLDLMSGCRTMTREAGEAILRESVAEGSEVDGEWVAIVQEAFDTPVHSTEVIGLRHFDEAVTLTMPEDPGPRVDWGSPFTWVQVMETCLAVCRAAISPPQRD